MDSENKILDALQALKNKQFKSIYAAAKHFEVDRKTLSRRASGSFSRAQAKESAQHLSIAEEKVLARWISQLSTTGYPPRHALVKEMAEEIRQQRVRRVNDASIQLVRYPPIGKEWIQRFLQRHPLLQTTAARQIESNRLREASFEALFRWFNAVEVKFAERKYDHHNIYNMDETGFGIGTSQTNRVIIDSTQRTRWKAVPGRQEWVSVIECISGEGTSLPPLLIFKAEQINSAWITKNVPDDWRFSASSKGWTSNIHGLQWLRTVFEPETREKASGKPRLLIADGHDSHITGNFIGHCMENNIDLLILPPHCSHILQPLDISVFGPLKTAHGVETDLLTATGIIRIQKQEWVDLYNRAREKALVMKNIKSAWKGAGLIPWNPQKAYDKLPSQMIMNPNTPQNKTPLDSSLLFSSPPDGTELRNSNEVLKEALLAQEVINTPTRKYISRLIEVSEVLNTQNTVLRKEIAEKEDVLQRRRTHKNGKRVVLADEIVMSTEKIRSAVAKVEEEARQKKIARKPHKRKHAEIFSEDENDDLIMGSQAEVSDIDDCIVVATVAK